MPAHCSSDQESYCSALICVCIHAGATISADMVYLLREASAGPAPLRQAYCSEVQGCPTRMGSEGKEPPTMSWRVSGDSAK
ncbi:hypothetical protein Sdia_01690 [Streptomyces diastaticus subsp. diastaticus]|uniref:Uncharacterized protein n=1 Tax=Streptomyces diastaticus subsp. diastaticus TaxID=68040 RepID=A0ABQ1CHD5_STRDI|nr:hypothetical protein Sdia_01690 [Streptomyces diastaticus subsp. diastaticus]